MRDVPITEKYNMLLLRGQLNLIGHKLQDFRRGLAFRAVLRKATNRAALITASPRKKVGDKIQDIVSSLSLSVGRKC